MMLRPLGVPVGHCLHRLCAELRQGVGLGCWWWCASFACCRNARRPTLARRAAGGSRVAFCC